MKTIVTQVIPTVQGEGFSIGTLVLLVRLGNCNLECNFCDSKWSNNLNSSWIESFDPNKNTTPPVVITDDNFDLFIQYLSSFVDKFKLQTLLITGGEPFCNKPFLDRLIETIPEKIPNLVNIEIETNGTLIRTLEDIDILINHSKHTPIQLNISPKLNPDYYRSVNIKSIHDIIYLFDTNLRNTALMTNKLIVSQFKFVYFKESEEDIIKFTSYFLEKYKTLYINIMPLTPARSDFEKEIDFLTAVKTNCLDTLTFCFKNEFPFSPRLHVWLFDQLKKDENFGLENSIKL